MVVDPQGLVHIKRRHKEQLFRNSSQNRTKFPSSLLCELVIKY